MKKSIVKSVLVLTGTAIVGTAYTPAPKHKPSAEVIATYLNGHKEYNPMKDANNWSTSEARKQEIMSNIRSIRCQIKHKADLLQRDQAAHKLLETIACTMENKTRNRDHQLRTERAKELHVSAKYIVVDVLRIRKGMPVVDMANIG